MNAIINRWCKQTFESTYGKVNMSRESLKSTKITVSLAHLFHTCVFHPYNKSIQYSTSASNTPRFDGIYLYLFYMHPHFLNLFRCIRYFSLWRPNFSSFGLIVLNCTLLGDNYCFTCLILSPDSVCICPPSCISIC